MGSFFSTADGHGGEYDYSCSRPLPEPQEHIARPMSKEALAAIQRYVDRSNSGLRPYTREEIVAGRICTLVHRAIKHYNSNNKGAEFEYPDQSTTEMKAACVGFRGTFWYHLAFSARPRDATERQHFFAELYFDRRSRQLAVETCIILEKPLCQFSNGCAFCPDESKILHPSHIQLGCGKKEHEEELYRERHQWDWDPRRKDYFRREMLETPFRLGGDRCPNFTVEKRAMKRNSSVRDVNISGTGECRLNC